MIKKCLREGDFLVKGLLNEYDNWTKKFMDSWKELDWERTLKLFSEDVEYYENPIDGPCKSFAEVKELWSVVAYNQKDIEYQYKIIAYNDDTCIINWQMNRTITADNNKQEIDGIFQIALNSQGLCSYFKQWRYTK